MDSLPPYTPGSTLRIKVCQIYIIVTVEKIFTPFTSSHVLVVHATSSSAKLPPNHPPLGTPMILKIYDTRYLEEREACYSYDRTCFFPARPWSLENEQKAIAYREATESWNDLISDEIEVSNPGMVIEYKMIRLAYTSWTEEVNAYLALADSPLSGSAVPTLYGFGDFISEEPRAIVPRILLLEYVPRSTSLNKLKNIKLITPWHIRTLLAATQKLNELGVIHWDLDPRNVLLCPDRVVIIDFGASTTRVQGGLDMFSDDEWMSKLEHGWNEQTVRIMLDQLRGHRVLARVTHHRAVLARHAQDTEPCK
jgi:serine/threonine protein kinase